jgi:apolipoprotein N-acyltransferase
LRKSLETGRFQGIKREKRQVLEVGIICKLIALLIILYCIFWVSFKVGVGLGYWGPFVMVCVGTLVGVLYGVAKLITNKKK